MMKKRRVYTAEFREEALSLLERSGKRAYEIEQDLGITHGLLYPTGMLVSTNGSGGIAQKRTSPTRV